MMGPCLLSFDLHKKHGNDYTEAYKILARWDFVREYNGKKLPNTTVYSQLRSRHITAAAFDQLAKEIKAAFAKEGLALTRICVVNFDNIFTQDEST